MKSTVLIIQHGHGPHRIIGDAEWIHYSDIFRSTCLLEEFRGCHVSWITDMAAEELFLDNHLIDELILADHPVQLSPESVHPYDVVINLEQEEQWRQFAAQIPASHRYGYLNGTIGNATADGRPSTFQERVFALIGRQWSGQHYVLGYRPHVETYYEVGLNQFVAPGMGDEAWSKKSWQALYRGLRETHDVSWPKALDSIQDYIDWMASCRVVVTGKNLGLHLALALNKKVVVLMERYDRDRVYLYGNGMKLTALPDGAGSLQAIMVSSVLEVVQQQLEVETKTRELTFESPFKSSARIINS